MTLLNIINVFLQEIVKQDIQQERDRIEQTLKNEQLFILNNPNLTIYEKELYLEKIKQKV